MIEEIHEGSFGTHANGHAMARKILRAGYYWLTMESDCCAHVRKCHKCQAFADNVNGDIGSGDKRNGGDSGGGDHNGGMMVVAMVKVVKFYLAHFGRITVCSSYPI